MYQHNKVVYEELKNRLKTNSRVCVVQATGTGKGVIARTLIEEYESVIVVAPTKAILKNYQMNLKVKSGNVEYFTYQAISMLLNPQLDNLAKGATLLILDEFHRIGAKTWGRKVEYLAEKIENINGKVVGLSATPVRYLDNERDMSIEFFKGNIVSGLNLVEAVVNGVLPTFKYVVSYYGYEKDLFKKMEERKDKLTDNIKALVANLENNYSIGKIIRQETKDLGKNQKWIVFFSSVEELESFRDTVSVWFDKKVTVYTLHSYSNYKENMNILNDFNNAEKGVNVLLSVNMLNEGVHIQGVDGIIMMRRTISPIVYLQQLGRALQVGGKEPIIFDFIGNYRRMGEYKDNVEIFNFVDEINNGLNNNKIESLKERKIIVSSYCEDISNILEAIQKSLYSWHFWTDEENEIIKKYYSKGGSRLCHKKGLDYIPMARIGEQARKMGLSYHLNWTPEEDEIIIKYYSKYGVNKCIEKGLTYKSRDSIYDRAKELGVPFFKSDWSEEEINILKTYFPMGGSHLCIEKGLSNRTVTQISSKANRLKIFWEGKMSNYSNEEDEIIRTYFPIGGAKLCIQNGLNRTLSAISSRASLLGLKHPNKVIPWTEEELNIIRKYYPIGGTKACIEHGLKNRSIGAISQKVRILGLDKGDYFEDWEIEIIYKYYPIGGAELCKEKGINREGVLIRMQAKRLNLKMSDWEDWEVEILKACYAKGGSRLCQENGINRDSRIIREKAKELNLKYVNWEDWEIELVKKYYPIGKYKLCQAKGITRSGDSIYVLAKKLKLI